QEPSLVPRVKAGNGARERRGDGETALKLPCDGAALALGRESELGPSGLVLVSPLHRDFSNLQDPTRRNHRCRARQTEMWKPPAPKRRTGLNDHGPCTSAVV